MPRHAALIIIDMQRGMLPENTGPRNDPQAEDNMATLLQAWREKGFPIVHVRHMGRAPDSPFWPGSPNCQVQPRFEPLASDACYTYDKIDHLGVTRPAEDWRIASLSNLDGAHATIRPTPEVLARRGA